MRSDKYIANGSRPDNPDVQAMLRDSVESGVFFNQYYCPFSGLSRRLLSKLILLNPAWRSHACIGIALHMPYPW